MITSFDRWLARNPARSWADVAARESLTPYAGCPEDEQVEIVATIPFDLAASRILINGTKTMRGLPVAPRVNLATQAAINAERLAARRPRI